MLLLHGRGAGLTDGSVPSWGTDYRARSRKRIAAQRWTCNSSGPATGAAWSSTFTGSAADRRLDVSGATTWSVLLPDAGSTTRRRTHSGMCLFRCPALTGRRLRRLGTINPEAIDVRDDGVVLDRRLPRPTEPPRLRPVKGLRRATTATRSLTSAVTYLL